MSVRKCVLVVLGLPVHNLLALDQSSHITGYAIFKDGKLEKFGKIECNEKDIGDRLVSIRNKITALIQKEEINEIVFEDIQMQGNVANNVQTFKILAEVFGIIYELATELKIKNSAVLASQWKSGLSIKGRTRPEQKRAAQAYVVNKYSQKPTQDECDAICIGEYALSQAVSAFDWSE